MFKKILSLIILISLFAPAFSYAAFTSPEPLTTEEIQTIISDGVIWLKNSQEENGHFKYEYLPFEDRYLEDDNIVRQAGAFFNLAEVAKHDLDDKYDLEINLDRATKYFTGLSKKSTYKGKSFKCITNSKYSSSCKLGATSLALIGLLDFVERYPENKKQLQPLINDYANYILAMKKDNAGYRNTLNTRTSLSSEQESSFFNGEALYALVRYYQFKPSKNVRATIDDTFDYINSSAVPFDTALYLWAMAALKDMNELWPNQKYVTYAKNYTTWRILSVSRLRESDHNLCAYIEGVTSAYTILEPHVSTDLKKFYKNEINYWMNKSAELQLTEKNQKNFGAVIKNPTLAYGGFLTGKDNPTQRIDFTQHCLSTYLQKLVDIDGKTL